MSNKRRKFAEKMCELAAEVDNNGNNEEEEDVAAAGCIEDIPDIAGFQMTRDETREVAEWSRNHFDAAGETADECEENMDAIIAEYVNGTDTLAPCHEK